MQESIQGVISLAKDGVSGSFVISLALVAVCLLACAIVIIAKNRG